MFGLPRFYRLLLAALAFATASVYASAAYASVPYAPPGVLPSDGDSDYARALHCLTQAISYEAGNEPVEGQEAVAQVILNRVRHRAYPSTVCGVVYQGSSRKTGCQFTFTCDGSLRRGRSDASMDRSRVVAARMLAGQSSALVGGATHYHADYVAPYWAPSLIKVKRIGAHIFYRLPGAPDHPAIAAIAGLSGEPVVNGAGKTANAPQRPSVGTFSPWGLRALVVKPSGVVVAAD